MARSKRMSPSAAPCLFMPVDVFTFLGAGGRNRTDMMFPSLDFESSASTSFTTPAWRLDTYSTGLSAVKKAEPALIPPAGTGVNPCEKPAEL